MDKTPPEKLKPSLHLSVEDLPEIKSWKVGGKYELTAKVKMTSLSENEYHGKKDTSASFEILEITDKDFKNKSYKDLMHESGEGEKND